MIIQRFTSGLGNQMFQYTFFRLLKKNHPGEKIKADLTWFDCYNEHQGYELKKLFDIDLPVADHFEIARVSGQLPEDVPGHWSVNRLLGKICGKYKEKHCREEISLTDMLSLKPGSNIYITGFYVSEGYYKDDLPEIRKVFRFPQREADSSLPLIREIVSTESVSVHVRRGDYLDPVYKDKFDLLREDYYRLAVDRIREIYDHPHFFIFSDDTEFITKAFDWIPEKERTIVSGNTGADSWKDMYLMSKCRGNIIANSTFSTWGALLGDPEGRHVIYPSAYIAGQDSERKTLEGWERI